MNGTETSNFSPTSQSLGTRSSEKYRSRKHSSSNSWLLMSISSVSTVCDIYNSVVILFSSMNPKAKGPKTLLVWMGDDTVQFRPKAYRDETVSWGRLKQVT